MLPESEHLACDGCFSSQQQLACECVMDASAAASQEWGEAREEGSGGRRSGASACRLEQQKLLVLLLACADCRACVVLMVMVTAAHTALHS